MVDYTKIARHMRDGMRRYVEQGIPTGRFLYGVLSNDLRTAVKHADDLNVLLLREWVDFLDSELPPDCYGSPAAVKAWRGTNPQPPESA
jgi:hypothetical protein